jgi:hypothetical protein
MSLKFVQKIKSKRQPADPAPLIEGLPQAQCPAPVAEIQPRHRASPAQVGVFQRISRPARSLFAPLGRTGNER